MKRPTGGASPLRGYAEPLRDGEARVDVDAALWRDERRDGGLLRCTLRVNGVPMHLEAVAVRVGRAGVMVAEVPEDEERLTALDGMYSARWTTTSIVPSGRRRAREYVLYAVPFED
jgi:hypothetical protein